MPVSFVAVSHTQVFGKSLEGAEAGGVHPDDIDDRRGGDALRQDPDGGGGERLIMWGGCVVAIEMANTFNFASSTKVREIPAVMVSCCVVCAFNTCTVGACV